MLHSFFGINRPTVFFDVVLHVGTLLAVVVFFRKRLNLNMPKRQRQNLFNIGGYYSDRFSGIDVQRGDRSPF